MASETTRIRWLIVSLLTGFSIVSYVHRMNISIAAKFMMPDLGLSQVQMGQIFSSFMLGYALFQVPGGMLGDWLGPRRVLTGIACVWGASTLLTGLVPDQVLQTSLSTFISLLLLRFLLGTAEAPMYPVAARAIANWSPVSERAFAYAVIVAGASLGSAVTPPLISWFMVRVGWRETFYMTSASAFLIAALWLWYATDYPEQNPRVAPRELALIRDGRDTHHLAYGEASWRLLLRNRNIFLLSLSYFCGWYVLFIFVFWLYLYLVEVRGFSVLSGGIFTSLPFVVSLVAAPLGGAVTDKLSRHLGPQRGRRIVALPAYLLAGGFLLLGAKAENPYLAIAGLSLSVGLGYAAEGAFWATAIDLGNRDAGTASGIMNMWGNLGGVVSTALVPVLVKYWGWLFALGSGAILAALGGLIWLAIGPDQKSKELDS